LADELIEITDHPQKTRYILRRNPLRAEEIKLNRQEKIQAVNRKLQPTKQPIP
jgi:hypothetical protein